MVSFNEAVSAYSRLGGVAGNATGTSATAISGSGSEGGDFTQALKEATEGAIETMRSGETQSFQATVGNADMNEVVMAVNKAELTLQTVVSIRDKAVQAYQDILRMPI